MSALTLLPAVDVAGGQAVRLVQGAAGTETGYGDPLQAALAWQAAGAEWIHLVDLDAAFGRGTNAALLAERRAASSTSPSSCPAASATTHRWPPRWPPDARASTSAPPRWRARTGCARPSRSTATRSLSAWTCGVAGSPPAAGPRTAATWTRPWPGWRPTAAPASWSPTSPGTARSPAPTWTCCGRSAPRTSRPVIASGGVSSLADLRAIAALVPVAWRAPSSARRCTPGRSPWRRRWRRWPDVTRRDLIGDGVGAGRRVQPRRGGGRLRLRVRLHLGAWRRSSSMRATPTRRPPRRSPTWPRRPGRGRRCALATWCGPGCSSPTSRRWEEYGRAHGAAFGDVHARDHPWSEVSALIDPRMLVEVEAVACRPGDRQRS